MTATARWMFLGHRSRSEPAGIASTLYRIACARRDAEILSWADLWAERAARRTSHPQAFYDANLKITPDKVARVSLYHGPCGVWAIRALIARALGAPAVWDEAIERFASDSRGPAEILDLMLGRTGTLIGCAILLEASRLAAGNARDASRRRLQQVGDDAVAEISEGCSAGSAVTSETGIAHGWAGLLYAALLWEKVSGTSVPDALLSRLDFLAGSAEPFGRGVRWPIRLEAAKGVPAYMGSWCNGAPGQTHLWALAFDRWREPRFGELAERCAWNAWEERSPVSTLCCGDAGRAYAMLAYHRLAGGRSWLSRTRETLERGAGLSRAGRGADAFTTSLYKGDLGIAVVAAEIVIPGAARQPFFELEP